MSSFTNNTSDTSPFGLESDRERSGHYTWMPQQQNATIIGNPSRSDLHRTGESNQESYTVYGFLPHTSSWLNDDFPDLSFSAYGEGTWPSDQYNDETCLESLFGVPESGAAESNMNFFAGMHVAAPLVEQAISVPSRALPTFQSFPSSPPIWTQTPGPPRQSACSLYYPVHATGQHNYYSNPISCAGAEHEIFPFQLATSSVITGHSDRRFFQTGLQPITTSNSVESSSPISPIPVQVSPSTSQSGGEPWDPPNTTMFQCSWTSHGTQCSAWIQGDRKSVTSHLRDEHNFTCDIQVIVCAWAGCTKRMRRRNIPRHIVACHFAVKVTCSECGMTLSRADAKNKHRLTTCTGVRKLAVTSGVEDEGGCFY